MKVTFLRLPTILNRYELRRSTLYHYIALGLWVRPVSLGPGVVVWPAHEVESIIEARMRGASDAGIKEIVEKLHAARLSNSAPCVA